LNVVGGWSRSKKVGFDISPQLRAGGRALEQQRQPGIAGRSAKLAQVRVRGAIQWDRCITGRKVGVLIPGASASFAIELLMTVLATLVAIRIDLFTDFAVWPLIVLAIGSVAAGWIGIPHAIGGHNELAAWLEPSFSAPRVAGEAAVSEAAAEAGEAAEAEHAALELTLMGVSLTIAVAGIAFAYFVWIKRRRIADNMVREFPGLHRLLLNKYYVDELYDATIVQPIKAASTEGLWRWFDVRVIDGAVNGAASIVDDSAGVLRRLQSGSVRAYAGSLFVGVVMILGYYLWL
jgi:NADH:ubiquinone oxidoreductase subunit 5 (subunit L)/multisubunit Na+/H+ antiporter MnhA subunit